MPRADGRIQSALQRSCRLSGAPQNALFTASTRGSVLPPKPPKYTTSYHLTKLLIKTGAQLASSRWYNGSLKHVKETNRSFATLSRVNSWFKGSGESAGPDSTQSFEKFKSIDIPGEGKPETEQLPTRRVHILGVGSIGTLIAHSLQCLPNAPPISLLMHRPELYDNFSRNGRIVRLVNPNTGINDEQFGYDIDILRRTDNPQKPFWEHIPHRYGVNEEPKPVNVLEPGEILDSGEVYIYTLIVTVKGPATVRALQSVKHRINSQTTICLVQNGMGQVDELNQKVFTDPESRPTYLLGIISHGAYMSGDFSVVHAGFGTTALGIYRDTDKYPLPPRTANVDPGQVSEEARKRMFPTDEELFSNLSSRYLLRILTRSPVLTCAVFPYLDLFQLQLEKLAQNCVMNPLTAILNIPNGFVLKSDSIGIARRLLLAEISLVMRRLPELEGVPGVNARFSPGRLETLCNGIATKTAKNSSSMREDVRNMRGTEIDYINGYIVRRGEEMGIKCVLNYLMATLIHAKTEATTGGEVKPYGTASIESDVPLVGTSSKGTVTLDDRGTQLKGKTY